MDEKKHNGLLVAALIVGVAYLVLSIVGLFTGTLLGGGLLGSMMGGILSSSGVDDSTARLVSSSLELAGSATSFALLLLLPSFIVIILGVVFNALGVTRNKDTFALLAGIFYVISLVLGFNLFTLASAILSFIAYSQMHGTSNA